MNSAALTNRTPRELARRASGGLEITLYWHAHANSTALEIYDATTEETITFPVAAERALDAFYHPFAHLAEQDAALTAFDRHEGLDQAPIFDEGVV